MLKRKERREVGMFSFFKKKQAPAEENKPFVVKAYLSGKVVPIEEVKDEVFSSKALGDGLAIEPESVLMEGSRHAVGLTLANGVEILIHEGIDTVNMEGDGFEYFVKEGDKVNAGDKLLSFDPEKIKEHGYEKTCILVVTNGDDYPDMKLHTGMDAVQGETVIAEF